MSVLTFPNRVQWECHCEESLMLDLVGFFSTMSSVIVSWLLVLIHSVIIRVTKTNFALPHIPTSISEETFVLSDNLRGEWERETIDLSIKPCSSHFTLENEHHEKKNTAKWNEKHVCVLLLGNDCWPEKRIIVTAVLLSVFLSLNFTLLLSFCKCVCIVIRDGIYGS